LNNELINRNFGAFFGSSTKPKVFVIETDYMTTPESRIGEILLGFVGSPITTNETEHDPFISKIGGSPVSFSFPNIQIQQRFHFFFLLRSHFKKRVPFQNRFVHIAT
jgi:hypothetical protein